jgi:hypothetical protein
MVPAIYYLSSSKFWTQRIKEATKYVAVSLLVLQLVTIFDFASSERVPFKSESLRFMYASDASVNRIDPSVKMLEKYLANSMIFQCNNAFYAGSNMQFQSNSKYYVNWGEPDGFDSKVSSDYTFICNLEKANFDSLKAQGIVVDYRILEYLDNDTKDIRYNVIVSGYHVGI